jgi:2,4-didehydro-3-deoxy-L-rhamnonate hydrolase
MKLVRYGLPGKEKPGLIDAEGKIRDLSDIVPDLSRDFLGPRFLDKVKRARLSNLPLVRGKPRLASPVAMPGNFIGVGLNYSDHAKDVDLPIPTEPILFNKAPNCISGPNDAVVLPKDATKLDYEVELAIVIGSRASHVSTRGAMDHIAGFCLANDVSERSFQMDRGGQWMKGKSAPTFGPLGPFLVTPDEIEDVQRIGIWLDVNGERRQTGNTRKMIFSVKKLVSYISDFMVLDPGDVIVTGTPPGVGIGMKPPKYLQVGDVVSLGADGLGEQRQEIIAWKRGM